MEAKIKYTIFLATFILSQMRAQLPPPSIIFSRAESGKDGSLSIYADIDNSEGLLFIKSTQKIANSSILHEPLAAIISVKPFLEFSAYPLGISSDIRYTFIGNKSIPQKNTIIFQLDKGLISSLKERKLMNRTQLCFKFEYYSYNLENNIFNKAGVIESEPLIISIERDVLKLISVSICGSMVDGGIISHPLPSQN